MRASNRLAKYSPTDWQWQLPLLCGKQVRLRELRPSDAPSLLAMLTTEAVTRFTSPPPTTVEHFERFINWTLRHRTAGDFLCFAVIVGDADRAVGIFQVRRLDKRFETAEWGFALGSDYWGTGVFRESAELVLDFIFNVLGVHRLEARAALLNGRGNAALLKAGALPEGILRKSFHRDDQFFDQVLYAMLGEDWRASRASRAAASQSGGGPLHAPKSPFNAARLETPRPGRSLSLVPLDSARK